MNTGGDKYLIKRYRIGSNYAYNTETLESLVDSLVESGGWMVWMMHTSDDSKYSSEAVDVLSEVIDYCKEQGIEIVTADQGFSLFYK